MTSPTNRFGKYTLVSKLGMGGMAEVFKAQLAGDPKVSVAIKRILPQFSNDKKLISMLIHEARLSVGLSHRNIVPVLDFGMVDGDYFIAMEYVRGKDLKSILIRCKTRQVELPFPMAVFIAIEMLKGLDHAHNKRNNFDQPLDIVHRDISPQNVIISMWGQVKILDFGIAKAATSAESTQTGILKGKFSYMSPEQAYAEEIDSRTDLYSTGILLWELLTLESCFQAETDLKLLEKVRSAEVRDPATVNPKIPKDLSTILMKALERKPKKRFQSAYEFAQALNAFQKDRFGVVTEADLGAFVRALFGVSPQELDPELSSAASRPPEPKSSDPEMGLAETMAGVDDVQSSFSSQAQRRRAKAPLSPWVWKIPLAAAAGIFLLVMLWIFPPRLWFYAYDRQVLKLAEWIQSSRIIESEQIPSADIVLPQFAQPLYEVRFSAGAKEILAELPFETFDRLREHAIDLSYDPHPKEAVADIRRPGLWSLSMEGYQVAYKINDQPKSILIELIEKGR